MLAFFSKWLTANHLTILRVLLVPVIYVGMVIWEENHGILLGIWVLFVFACMTDYWDGVLARHQKQNSKLGILLDPIADKILILTLLILLVGIGRAPAYLVAILITREFAVTGLRAMAAADGMVIEASSGGKIKAISQMFTVGFLMIHYPTLYIPTHEVGIVLLWGSTIISVGTGVNYFVAFYRSLPET